MSHDTQVKQEVPERIFAVIGEGSELTMAIWATFDARDKAERYPGPRMLECAPRQVVEYVRADLLATVRREEREAAFKEIRERIEAVNPSLTFGSANGSMVKKCILTEITALEASATEKGEMNG